MSAVVRTIDGKQVTFRRFTAEEVIDFCEIAYLHRLEQLQDAKRSGVDTKASLDELMEQRGDLQPLFRYAKSPFGAAAVLKAVKADEASVNALDLYGRAALALEVCGFRLPSEDEVKQEGDGFERPT